MTTIINSTHFTAQCSYEFRKNDSFRARLTPEKIKQERTFKTPYEALISSQQAITRCEKPKRKIQISLNLEKENALPQEQNEAVPVQKKRLTSNAKHKTLDVGVKCLNPRSKQPESMKMFSCENSSPTCYMIKEQKQSLETQTPDTSLIDQPNSFSIPQHLQEMIIDTEFNLYLDNLACSSPSEEIHFFSDLLDDQNKLGFFDGLNKNFSAFSLLPVSFSVPDSPLEKPFKDDIPFDFLPMRTYPPGDFSDNIARHAIKPKRPPTEQTLRTIAKMHKLGLKCINEACQDKNPIGFSFKKNYATDALDFKTEKVIYQRYFEEVLKERKGRIGKG